MELKANASLHILDKMGGSYHSGEERGRGMGECGHQGIKEAARDEREEMRDKEEKITELDKHFMDCNKRYLDLSVAK